MVLYYAMGGGLGHLVRADVFLKNRGITEFRIITASPYAAKIFEPHRLILIPREFETHVKMLSVHLQEILGKLRPEAFYVDTFSHGILGELNDIRWGNISMNYLTRHMKWEVYAPKIKRTVNFDTTFILEPLAEEHMAFIEASSVRTEHVSLEYPGHAVDPEHPLARPSEKEKWFIVHSGPAGEVNTLISRARQTAFEEHKDPQIMVITQEKMKDTGYFTTDLCPVHGYFPYASRIFTACGFNIMHQTALYRDRHHFIPFARKYDDQFLRAERAKTMML